MKGKVISKYNLKRSHKVKTLPTTKRSSKDDATVYCYLLFSRLVVLANGSNISCDDCIRNKL